MYGSDDDGVDFFSFLLFVFPVIGRNFSSHKNNVRMIYEMKLLVEPTENSEISEPQMGFEPRPSVINSAALTTELLETLWRARAKCGSLTRAAPRSYRVK